MDEELEINPYAIPNLYSIRSEEDFFLLYWLSTGKTLEDYTPEKGESAFQEVLNTHLFVVYDQMKQARSYGTEFGQLSPAMQQLANSQQAIDEEYGQTDGYENREVSEIVGWTFSEAVAAGLDSYDVLNQISSSNWSGIEGERLKSFFEAYLYSQQVEETGELDPSAFANYDTNSNTDDQVKLILDEAYMWLPQLHSDYLDARGILFLQNAPQSKWWSWLVYEAGSLDPVDIVAVVDSIANDFLEWHKTSTASGIPQTMFDHAYTMVDNINNLEGKQTLDLLRQIVYDPTWIPSQEATKLAQLSELINGMPTQVVGVDVSWVKASFQQYYLTMFKYNDWRTRLKMEIDSIEMNAMREKTFSEELGEWWWLAEIALSILVEPLDWLFTARDLMMGEWSALIGLLPLVPSALAKVGKGSKYLLGNTNFLDDLPIHKQDELRLLPAKLAKINYEKPFPRQPPTGIQNYDRLVYGTVEYEAWEEFLHQHGFTLEATTEIAERGYVTPHKVVKINPEVLNYIDMLHENHHVQQIIKAEQAGVLDEVVKLEIADNAKWDALRRWTEKDAYEFEMKIGIEMGFSEDYMSFLSKAINYYFDKGVQLKLQGTLGKLVSIMGS